MQNQSQTMGKITSVLRVVMMVGVICVVFLAANFALTVTAVVSNKDVYVNSGNLVTSSGDPLKVKVAMAQSTIYEFPHQKLESVVKTEAIAVRFGDDKLVLYPGMFEYRKVGSFYELHMQAVDGTTITWGPPSSFSADGSLTRQEDATPSIRIRRPDGQVHTNIKGEGRRLPSLPDGIAFGDAQNGISHAVAHCSARIKNGRWTKHNVLVTGWAATDAQGDHDQAAQVAIYLPATGLEVENVVDTPMCQAMAGKGVNTYIVEYYNQAYFHDDTGFTNRAGELGTCINEICGTTGSGDCLLGVGIFGFSQGGQLAFCVPDYAEHITAALSFSGSIHYGNSGHDWNKAAGFTKNSQWNTMSAHMSAVGKSHRRLIMGATDGVMGSSGSESAGGGEARNIVWGAQRVSGRSDVDCTGTGPYASGATGKMHCIQTDGSGYYIVQATDFGGTFSGHEWFCAHQNDDPIHGVISGLQAFFTNEAETAVWGLHSNLNWLKTAATGSGH